MSDNRGINRSMLKRLLVITVVMFGFGYALVPFYRTFCQVAGINAKRDENAAYVANTQIDRSRLVTVQFLANVNQQMPWHFRALTNEIRVNPGVLNQVQYEVTNTTGRTITAQAVPSYSPPEAAPHFKKLACFCFSSQTLAPHETRKMPVDFVVQPSLPKNIGVITLSYTFFEQGKGGQSQKD